MFRTKVRIHTCKIILLTSLAWFFIDVMLLTFFSDCIGDSGWNCKGDKNGDAKNMPLQGLFFFKVFIIKSILIFLIFFFLAPSADINNKGRGILYEQLLDRGRQKRSYHSSELKKWSPAKTVPENYGFPGEMGRAVNTAAEDEHSMKEMFKINQFNLMASDKISLNRSLPDVRLEG